MNKITYYRIKLGKSKYQMAKDLKISRQLLILWESNKRFPNFDNALKLAKYFNVSPLEFINEIELIENPSEAFDRLQYYDLKLANEFSTKMRLENKTLNAKLTSKTSKIINVRNLSASLLIVLFIFVGINSMMEDPKAGSIQNTIYKLEISRFICVNDTCLFKIEKVIEGNYENKYIELPNFSESDRCIVTVVVVNSTYKIVNYIPLDT